MASVNKAATKKVPAKKTPAKKAPAKKVVAKKAAAKQAAATGGTRRVLSMRAMPVNDIDPKVAAADIKTTLATTKTAFNALHKLLSSPSQGVDTSPGTPQGDALTAFVAAANTLSDASQHRI